MELKILPLSEVKKVLAWEPQKWNVISIGGNEGERPNSFANARSFVKLTFDDIDDKLLTNQLLAEDIKKTRIIPQTEEIKKGLDFARNLLDKPILIHCYAGISRSTAMAWLIIYMKFQEPRFATYFLYQLRTIARPNQRILRLGLKLLVPNQEERVKIWDVILNHPQWIAAHEPMIIQ